MSKTKKSRRMKAPEIPVPQTLAEAEALLGRMGARQRRVEALETEMNERLAAIKAEFEEKAAPITESIEADFVSLQAWAEGQRETLLDGRKKSTRLATGELGWRTTPPSVRITGKEKVLEALKEFGLERFIRTKEEPNKEAIKADAAAVENVKGISITQKEEFWVKPFESQIERSRARKVS